MKQDKIIILGAGPCGLGAAWRLTELGYANFHVYEQRSYPGGLASSFVDENGFTWDIGGHVQFSHYDYFDKLMMDLLKEEWLVHERESWIWIKDRFVPYPFQNNIKDLPKEDMWNCLQGLIDLYKNPHEGKPDNFAQWIEATLGKGIADIFMIPYNFKVWAYHPSKMMYEWTGERVAIADLERITKNIIFGTSDVSWGPNNTFRFPLRGGTGEIWKRLSDRIDPSKITLNKSMVAVNSMDKEITFSDGSIETYDHLISTIPLDKLTYMSDLIQDEKKLAEHLWHSSTHVFGVGLIGKPAENLRKKCWMYYPEDNCPFYRVTVFSNYSPNHVPDNDCNWSLMIEVSESQDKPVCHADIWTHVIDGLLATRLIESEEQIVDRFYHHEAYGYPTPSISRNRGLKLLDIFDERQLYSRGRFGAWKYEVSNQDHAMMQGVEIVNRIVKDQSEITVWDPVCVNG